MKKEIILEKGKYFLADVCEVKNLSPVALINGDDGEYVLWDFVKKENADFVWKDSQIGLFVAEDDNENFQVFELEEKTKAVIEGGAVSFGERFLLIDERGHSLLTSIEKGGEDD